MGFKPKCFRTAKARRPLECGLRSKAFSPNRWLRTRLYLKYLALSCKIFGLVWFRGKQNLKIENCLFSCVLEKNFGKALAPCASVIGLLVFLNVLDLKKLTAASIQKPNNHKEPPHTASPAQTLSDRPRFPWGFDGLDSGSARAEERRTHRPLRLLRAPGKHRPRRIKWAHGSKLTENEVTLLLGSPGSGPGARRQPSLPLIAAGAGD